MNIITPGRPTSAQHTTICRYCGCKFQFNESEIIREGIEPGERPTIPPTKKRVFVLRCPQDGCSEELRVEAP